MAARQALFPLFHNQSHTQSMTGLQYI
uniref:Uncharacterized protein n=1 Tax=Arundo donax TaxID=35708 RepID=A0A0A8YHS1_ARUDO